MGSIVIVIIILIIYYFIKNLIKRLLICIMDFIKKNKILTLMAAIAFLSFALEKVGIIHP